MFYKFNNNIYLEVKSPLSADFTKYENYYVCHISHFLMI